MGLQRAGHDCATKHSPKMNSGVGKRLYGLSHVPFWCLFLYLQKLISLQNHYSSEHFKIHSITVCFSCSRIPKSERCFFFFKVRGFECLSFQMCGKHLLSFLGIYSGLEFIETIYGCFCALIYNYSYFLYCCAT